MNKAWTWSPANERKAQRWLGVKAYRSGQRQLIAAVMNGRNAIGLLPTGGGKSLCFQLPSLFLPRAVLVVSPLISLMQDQEDKLKAHQIPSAVINSTLTEREEQHRLGDIRSRTPEIIYVTPERLEQSEYREVLRRSGVSLIVVDEAHCVSQWGHDFRPAYLAIRDAIRTLDRPPVLALTATATPTVISDIMTQLDIEGALVAFPFSSPPRHCIATGKGHSRPLGAGGNSWAGGPGIPASAPIPQRERINGLSRGVRPTAQAG